MQPICGDGSPFASCQKKPGHRGRHLFENEHVLMSWKNISPQEDQRRAQQRRAYALRRHQIISDGMAELAKELGIR